MPSVTNCEDLFLVPIKVDFKSSNLFFHLLIVDLECGVFLVEPPPRSPCLHEMLQDNNQYLFGLLLKYRDFNQCEKNQNNMLTMY